jgi:hypothetical protein
MDNEMTIEDCVRAAWAALMRGDYAERDRLCALAKIGFGSDEIVSGDKSIMVKEGTKQ